MTTRRQIFILVMLLFLGLAVIGGSLMAWLQLRTAKRDFISEVEAAAIAVTEFVTPADLAPIISGAQLAKGRLGTIFPRILKWEQVERIFIIDAAGAVLADTMNNAPIAEDLLQARPDRERLVYLGAPPTEGGSRRTQAAVIAAQHPTLRIGVEVSAESYFALRQVIRRDVMLFAVVTPCTGIVVALALALFVSREFTRLRQLASLVGEPGFERANQGASIKEVADVGGIIGVMHSVLMETVDQTRRSLVDHEPMRSNQDLGRFFRIQYRPNATWSCAGATGFFAAVGPPGTVQGTVAFDAGAGAAFIGLLPCEDGLDAALQARAASDYLVIALRRLALAPAASATRELFQLRELAVIRWSAGRMEEWTHRADGPARTTEGILPEFNPAVVSCLAADDRTRLAVYLRTNPGAPLERMALDLPALLVGTTSSIVLALRRGPA